MDGLGGLRRRIDALDDRLLAILNRRAALVGEVYALKLKQAQGGPVQAFVPGREAQILRRLSSRKAGAFPVYGIIPVFREIISACRSLEEMPRIAYVAGGGAQACQAALACFGSVADFVAQKNVAAVLAAVAKGRADFALVPAEGGAAAGRLAGDLQALSRSGLTICAEVGVSARYFVAGKTHAQPTGRDKTSVLLGVGRKSGSLSSLFKMFERRRAVLTPLKLTRSGGKAGGRCFLVEFNGHHLEPRLKRFLAGLARQGVDFKVLGSYPAV